MAELHPRKLAIILEDLEHELERWALKASTMIERSEYTQRQIREHVEQTQRNSSIVYARVLDDRLALESQHDQVDSLSSKGLEAEDSARRLVNEAIATLVHAQESLSHFETELAEARAWLARAEERVRKAEIELANAESALHEARSELARAQRAYAACRASRDDKGRPRNCSGLAARVAVANEAVNLAVARVEVARIELTDARAERARAQERVRCCEIAVGLAGRAVETADDAHSRALMALNTAERSVEAAQAAQKFLTVAKQKGDRAIEEVEDFMRETQLSAKYVEDSQSHFGIAEKFEESAHRLNIIARKELQQRIDRLYEIEHPVSLLQ